MQNKRKSCRPGNECSRPAFPDGPESRQQWDGLLSIDSHRTPIAHLIERVDYGAVIVLIRGSDATSVIPITLRGVDKGLGRLNEQGYCN